MKPATVLVPAVFVLTVLSWAITPPTPGFIGGRQVAELVGALALTGFALGFVISTRAGLLDWAFNGLDKAYVAHKWLGIGSVGLAAVHIVLLATTGGGHGHGRMHGQSMPTAQLGAPAMLLFVALVLTALVARRLRFEVWKTIHKFMAVPYVIGLVHYYGASSYKAFGASPFSLWMDVLTLVGVASALYSLFVYELTAFRHKYVVTAVRPVAQGVTEITATPTGDGVDVRPGQFVFVKGRSSNGALPSHPFTVSNGSGEPLQLTVKSFHDHTAAWTSAVKPGDQLAVAGPHGRFDYRRGIRRQVWIAGGIGITPFRAFYQADLQDVDVDLFYAFHGLDEACYLDELKSISREGLRVHLVDDTRQGFMTAQMIADAVPANAPVDVFFCGPVEMRDAIRDCLAESGLQVGRISFEEFTFGR